MYICSAQSADCVAQTEDPQNACQSGTPIWHTNLAHQFGTPICRLRNTNCANC